MQAVSDKSEGDIEQNIPETQRLSKAARLKINLSNISIDEHGFQVKRKPLENNSLIGLMIIYHKKNIWPLLPMRIKVVWIFCIVMGLGTQWLCALLLLLYLFGNSYSKAFIDVFVATFFLFIYVLNEIDSKIRALQHFWSNSPQILTLKNPDYLGYFIFGMLVMDLLLVLQVAIISVLSIGTCDNISDQLQVALTFFYILQLDEWMYEGLIQKFYLLSEEDFQINEYIGATADDFGNYLNQKALSAIKYIIALCVLIIYVIVYFLSV